MSYRTPGDLDKADVAKKGFLLGAALFALGAVGEIPGRASLALPAVAEQVFFGTEVTGVGGLVGPIAFDAVSPLTG